jgi:hypothetical protein
MELSLQEIHSHFAFQLSLLRLCQIPDTEMSKLEQMIPEVMSLAAIALNSPD